MEDNLKKLLDAEREVNAKVQAALAEKYIPFLFLKILIV